jgi:hypothetical protein
MVPYTNKPADEGGEDDIVDAFDEAQRVETQLLRAPLNRYVVSTLDLHLQSRSGFYNPFKMIEVTLCVML